MTLVQLASLSNLTGVGLVLALSVFVLARYPGRFFRTWTLSYACVFASMGTELIATTLGRSRLLSVGEVLLIGVNVAYLQRMGQALPTPRPAARWAAVLNALACAVGLGLAAAGTAFPLAALVPMLVLTASAVWLGVMMIRQRTRTGWFELRWIGVPLVVVALLPLTFPLLSDTPHVWLGYWTGGVLHLLVGLGMVLFVLSSVSHDLAERNASLTQLDRLKSNFIGTVTHELRTPLAAIRAGLWLLDHGPEQNRAELRGILDENVSRLEGLIGDVLDFSRIEEGKLAYERMPVDVAGLAAGVARDMSPLFAAKGVALHLELGEDAQIVGDPQRLGQVVRNLLSNALKFTPEQGGVTLTVAAEEDRVRLRVRDDGIGIAPEHQDAIFERFFQVDNGMARRAAGTGLGLTITKAIVEEGHGGTIRVDSRPGAGTTFEVVLPWGEA